MVLFYKNKNQNSLYIKVETENIFYSILNNKNYYWTFI
jgi:hypothetical protein